MSEQQIPHKLALKLGPAARSPFASLAARAAEFFWALIDMSPDERRLRRLSRRELEELGLTRHDVDHF